MARPYIQRMGMGSEPTCSTPKRSAANARKRQCACGSQRFQVEYEGEAIRCPTSGNRTGSPLCPSWEFEVWYRAQQLWIYCPECEALHTQREMIPPHKWGSPEYVCVGCGERYLLQELKRRERWVVDNGSRSHSDPHQRHCNACASTSGGRTRTRGHDLV